MRRYLECGGTLLVHGREVPGGLFAKRHGDGQGGFFVGLGHAVASGEKSESGWDRATFKLTARFRRVYHPTYSEPSRPP